MNPKLFAGMLTAVLLHVFSGVSLAQPPDAGNFVAHLDGANEVPPVDTFATGQAVFKLGGDGTVLDYKLIVANIDNVVAAHIHLASAGMNGPVVAFVAGSFAPGGGPVDGILAEGTITEGNLIGPLAGQDLSVLVAAMRSGGTYVNVHTNDGEAPVNTGPGDFASGEVRGQIATAGRPTPQ
ncbi:CHRD domain-containing protein [Marinobacterium nitratireducens]|uniref:CHRD domain-containing protein n=1 Tax=Marinobacterium nitratireducens TaxID=518897 RepID=A0A917ZN77_9GAMM|nr:CHRD domain-containing protein [Marinobacterium nitratireducens]GGO85722.1 CHRD domain-containing protein [Marinobacterium nitratireducens]